MSQVQNPLRAKTMQNVSVELSKSILFQALQGVDQQGYHHRRRHCCDRYRRRRRYRHQCRRPRVKFESGSSKINLRKKTIRLTKHEIRILYKIS